jgi:PKD domain-containing protein
VRHRLGSALGLVARRRWLLPVAALAAVVFVLATRLPPAFAHAPAPLGQVIDSRSVHAPSGSPTPSPSPSQTVSDVPAQPAAPATGGAIVNPTSTGTLRPAASRPTPTAPPKPPPTAQPSPQPTPTDNPPTVILNATPVGGGAPLRVTANATLSWDTDATGIVGYQFNWGDGLTTALQASPTATHLYNVAGSYQLTVLVVDSAGLWSTASTTIKVG